MRSISSRYLSVCKPAMFLTAFVSLGLVLAPHPAASQQASPDSSSHNWLNGNYSGTAESGWTQCWKFSVKGDKITGSMERSKGARSYFEDFTAGQFEGDIAAVKVKVAGRTITYRFSLTSKEPKVITSISSHRNPVTNILKPGC